MIEVESLSRSFGPTRAVDDVSFRIEQGEVVGLLGPNGAGKTTTMRMICGCIGATKGEIRIDGREIWEAPLETKARIGYLPEQPPVYDAMSVENYIEFAAQVRKVKNIDDAVDQVLELVGLQGVRERIIAHLSKGFRQRVGLAQALVHDPEILILDEPSSGLDPEQRVNFHKLVADLALGDRTVILSTHILGDVSALCERVLIIHRGRLVADESIRGGTTQNQRLRIEFSQAHTPIHATMQRLLEQYAQVHRVESINAEHTQYTVVTTSDIRETLIRDLSPMGLVELRTLNELEQLYFERTSENGP